MSHKRKAESGNGKKKGLDSSDDEDEYSTSSSYAPSAIDVSFNYVAPTEIDYMALKRLIQQLYHTNSVDIDLGALADHIIQSGSIEKLGERAIGTVVKVEDDEDGDPFAFASALMLSQNGGSASKTLTQYYEKVCASSSTSNTSAKAIVAALHKSEGPGNVLHIFHERMINLPPQIMPPLYRMLFDEIRHSETLTGASHLLFFSRVFSMDALSDDEEADGDTRTARAKAPKAKKTRKGAPVENQAITKVSGARVGAAGEARELGLFHPEDTILAKYAEHTFTFAFPAVRDSDGTFNAPMFGRIALLKKNPELFDIILTELEKAFAMAT